MRLGTIPESLLERLLLAVGLVPTPFLDTHVAMLLARTVMTATRLGVFEVLADPAHGPATAAEVAAACGTDPRATAKLLEALAGAGYVSRRRGRYRLTRPARRWLLAGAERSLRDKMLWQFTEWEWLERSEDYVRTGRPVAMHEAMTPELWHSYQRAMRSVASVWSGEVARRTPVPRGARRLLDVGGSHGRYSAALCRRHPGLEAVVLDLPPAVAAAAPLLADERMGERVVHRAGDVLTDELGEEEWDVVLVAQLAHHFDEATNRQLARRVARALVPGGAFVLQETVRPERAGQLAALFDLYFSLTSAAGTWSFAEMADWQRAAGLRPLRPKRFLSAPGSGQQTALKPLAA